jgi:hypothetical protein
VIALLWFCVLELGSYILAFYAGYLRRPHNERLLVHKDLLIKEIVEIAELPLELIIIIK